MPFITATKKKEGGKRTESWQSNSLSRADLRDLRYPRCAVYTSPPARDVTAAEHFLWAVLEGGVRHEDAAAEGKGWREVGRGDKGRGG